MLGELGLVGGLLAVVELLGDASGDLARRTANVKAHFLGDRPNINPRNVASNSLFFRSAWIASATPGYWIFTATARPSCSRAAWTWPIEAAARGSQSNSANALSAGG